MQSSRILDTLDWVSQEVCIRLSLFSLIGSIALLFVDSSPEADSTIFRVAFLGFIILPAAFNVAVLTILAFEKSDDAVAVSKTASDAALICIVPAATLSLPLTYWQVHVLMGLLIIDRIAIAVRQAKIDVIREMTTCQSGDARNEEDNAMNKKGGGRVYEALPAGHTLNDLAGMRDIKDRMLAAAKEALQVAKGRNKSGLRANYRNGILLYSDPGNGKTVLAEGLAGSLGVPIIKISFGNLASKYVNNTTENVVQMFRDARAQAPCVLFLDEVDSVIASRDGSSTDQEGPKTTNQILTELVSSRGCGVVIVMATNFLDRLDAAAIREGRVDFKIEVPAPDADARRAIITTTLNKARVPCEASAINQAVKRWEGFSASRIRSVTDQAVRQSKGRELRYVDLQNALRFMQGSLGERIAEDTPSLTDLHMPEQQRRSLLGIAKRMESVEEIEDMGGTVPTGLLLAGPPGTGKTLAVRSLAKTTGWPLLTSSGADLMADSRNIDKLIVKAKNARPCIVFIDEADDVFSDRRAGSNYSSAITNKLLTAIDGAGGKSYDILWVAAVNAPDTMDAAALRGGRFTEKIWFDNPDVDTAERIIKQWMGKSKARFADDLTAKRLADLLDGQSPANIQAVLQQAVNTMIARTSSSGDKSSRVVTLLDMETARLAVVGD